MLKRRRFNAQTPPLPKISQNRHLDQSAQLLHARRRSWRRPATSPCPKPCVRFSRWRWRCHKGPSRLETLSRRLEIRGVPSAGRLGQSQPAPTPVLIPAGDITIFFCSSHGTCNAAISLPPMPLPPRTSPLFCLERRPDTWALRVRVEAISSAAQRYAR